MTPSSYPSEYQIPDYPDKNTTVKSKFQRIDQDMLQSCRTKSQSIRIENPRPNLVERIHRNLGDIIRTEHVEDVENHMREVDVLLFSCV